MNMNVSEVKTPVALPQTPVISDDPVPLIADFLQGMQSAEAQKTLVALDVATGISLRLPANSQTKATFANAEILHQIYQGEQDNRLAHWLNQHGADLTNVREAAAARLVQSVHVRGAAQGDEAKNYALNLEFAKTVQPNLLAKTLEAEL